METTKNNNHSAFVVKTIGKVKEVLKYYNLSEEKLEKLAEAIASDEATAKKIAGVKFPSASAVSGVLTHSKERGTVAISDNEELVCVTEKAYVTSSRGTSAYTSTYYTISYRKGFESKTLAFSSSSTGRYGTSAATAKAECIMEALLAYFQQKA